MPTFDAQRAADSISHLQQNLQASVSKNHSLTDALRSIRERAASCGDVDLTVHNPISSHLHKSHATFQDIITLCDIVLETKQ